MKNIRAGISKAINAATSVPRDIVGGTKDYIVANNKAYKDADKTVGAKQRTMVDNIMRNAGNAPTPMGTEAYYGAVRTEAKKLKRERNVSLYGSIKKRLKNPND